jgi:hypothetical protein
MRKTGVFLGILGALFVAAPALANVFITGPGMVGHPGADDPSVGYSSIQLEEALASVEAGGPAVVVIEAPQPWNEAWYQLNQMPGV